ncbi:hypothetical protein [Pseudonocardia sp. NPDC046786]
MQLTALGQLGRARLRAVLRRIVSSHGRTRSARIRSAGYPQSAR